MKTGIELIAQERKEQIEKHGRTVASDVKYNSAGQLSCAARLLSEPGEYNPETIWDLINGSEPAGWDIELFKKMMLKPELQRLVIAGALIAAEIDRLQLLETKLKV